MFNTISSFFSSVFSSKTDDKLSETNQDPRIEEVKSSISNDAE